MNVTRKVPFFRFRLSGGARAGPNWNILSSWSFITWTAMDRFGKYKRCWALVSESDNRAPDSPIVRFAGVCTKSDVVNLVFEPDAR